MLKEIKYALDFMFLFMLIVSVTLFAINIVVPLDKLLLHTVEYIDYTVLGGYYFFFFHGLIMAKQKILYVRQHWIMALLLLVPFIPLARLLRLHTIESVLGIGTNTLWHILDEFGML